mgnify:CR=1 FL=1
MGTHVICQPARCSFLFSNNSLPQESLHSTLTRCEFHVSCPVSRFSSIFFVEMLVEHGMGAWVFSLSRVCYACVKDFSCISYMCHGNLQGCACGPWKLWIA